MSRTYAQFKLRFPADLQQALVVAAAESRRSISAEIIYRLQATFELGVDAVTLDNATAERLIAALQDHIKK
ncbi:Arc family DNA-binding protein [Stenotrophomonas acidaminiphila]|jgi:hypothetical protein